MVSVVAVTPRYPPGSLVGAWLSTHQALRSLVARGHQVTAAQSMGRQRPFDFEGVHVESCLRGRSYIGTLVRDADVVVSHANDSRHAVEMARTHDKPHVRMAHGAGHDADGANLVIFCSEVLRQATPHRSPSIVIHPPITQSEYQVRRRDADRITLMNCSKDKGVLTAWQMADLLPGHQFLGVRGHTGTQVEPRTKARNFDLIPATPDVKRVYSRTRILLVPSAYESYGRVGLEAMCSGIPVIASDLPGLREALGDGAIYHNRDDHHAWAETVRRLDDPAEYRTASLAAFKRVAELDTPGDLARFADAVEAVAAREEMTRWRESS